MKVIGKDRTSCDVCNPIDEILARLDALERRASAIVAKVQGIAPDGEGNVTLPTSSSDTDPLHGRIDAFAMSSEVKEAADDAHAYATSIADDVVVINSEIDALNQAVAALQPAEIEAIKVAVETLQTTVATLESTVATLNNSVAGKVSKAGDTMTGNLTVQGDPKIFMKNSDYTKGTNPSDKKSWIFTRALDNAGAPIISSEMTVDTSSTRLYQIAVVSDSGTWSYPFRVKAEKDNSTITVMAVQTGVENNDNSNNVATTRWVNSADSVVHKTGNEDISGIKKFLRELVRYHGNAGAGSIPTRDQYIPIVFCQGNDDNNFGWIRIFAQKDTKLRVMQFQVNKVNDDGTVSENAYIQLFADDGVNPARATAPTTPSGATGNEIATAGWVRNLINQFATANNLNGI